MMSRQLRDVLERVARRVREVRQWNSLALCWLAWALIGAVLAFAGVRSVVILSGLAMLALSSAFACVIFARRSARDLRGVARRIEASHPELDAVLLTAVEEGLSGPLERLGFLQETVVARALAHHNSHNWLGVVPQKALHRAGSPIWRRCVGSRRSRPCSRVGPSPSQTPTGLSRPRSRTESPRSRSLPATPSSRREPRCWSSPPFPVMFPPRRSSLSKTVPRPQPRTR